MKVRDPLAGTVHVMRIFEENSNRSPPRRASRMATGNLTLQQQSRTQGDYNTLCVLMISKLH